MIISAVAKRYAKALAEMARKEERLQKTAEELELFTVLFNESEDFRFILKHPAFREEERNKVLDALCKKASISDRTKNLVILLVENKRLDELPQIAAAMRDEVDKELGRVKVNVKTPVPLPLGSLKRLQLALEEKLGKKVEISPDVAPEIIGGVVTRIGNTVVDGSVAARIASMKRALTSKYER